MVFFDLSFTMSPFGIPLPEDNRPSSPLDFSEFLHMAAFDDDEAASASVDPQQIEGQARPTSSSSTSPMPTLPPPFANSRSSFSTSPAVAPPSGRPASWQPFSISPITTGPKRSFANAGFGHRHTQSFAGTPRTRQDSDILKYDSTAESSIYEEPWFSSSSTSLMSPGSPQSGYYSAGSVNDPPLFPNQVRPTRAVHSHPFGRPKAGRPRGPSQSSAGVPGIDGLTLGMRASSDEASASIPADKKPMQAGPRNEDSADPGLSLEESEDESDDYSESRRPAGSASKKRPLKKLKSAPRDPREEEEEESELSDLKDRSMPRSTQIRHTRLQSERKRRSALTNAFQDLRSLLPADIQRATKSQVLEGAAEAIRDAREERDKYRQLLSMLKAQKRLSAQLDGEELVLPPMPQPM